MAQLKVAAHRCAADVEIAVAHAQVVAAVAVVFDGERRHFAGVEDGELVGDNLDVAGRKLRVLGGALGNRAFYLYYKFTAEAVGGLGEGGIVVVVKYNLCNAVAVAEVYEGHTSHFAGALHPAGQGNFFALVAKAEFAACIASIHIDDLNISNS